MVREVVVSITTLSYTLHKAKKTYEDPFQEFNFDGCLKNDLEMTFGLCAYVRSALGVNLFIQAQAQALALAQENKSSRLK
jgi:hypothetical protein